MRNRARCALCNDVVESLHRHDFVQCSCQAIFVDGGQDYWRRGGEPQNFIEMDDSEPPPLPKMRPKDSRDSMEMLARLWGIDTGDKDE